VKILWHSNLNAGLRQKVARINCRSQKLLMLATADQSLLWRRTSQQISLSHLRVAEVQKLDPT